MPGYHLYVAIRIRKAFLLRNFNRLLVLLAVAIGNASTQAPRWVVRSRCSVFAFNDKFRNKGSDNCALRVDSELFVAFFTHLFNILIKLEIVKA